MAAPASEKKISPIIAPAAAAISPMPQSFEQAVALFDLKREGVKHAYLVHDTHLVSYEPGTITLRLAPSLPRDFSLQVAACLSEWTGQGWKVIPSDEPGTQTLHEQTQTRKEKQIQEAAATSLVSSVLDQFPGAKLVSVTNA
jgi:DNA polymerase-3 subunit gamma/tau